ncbi:MAG: PorP/SprF family type IX secretion system membrane protein [Chitinophagaceae bacterium]|nr:PorP/SprF family type IX secretion system membrane protein [Chitinophagaceae bacterium]
MRRHLLYLVFFCCAILQRVAAQDPHFSQYFSSPLSFNPALTGYFEGNSRFTANIRNQWAGIGDPYTTGTVSFESKILTRIVAPNDKWGWGMLALYDQAAGGVYRGTYLSLSTGFSKGLDAEGEQSISVGVQATLARNTVDFDRISFGNQLTSGGYDLSIPSGESINNRSVHYADLNAGILYNYKDENENQLSIGASMYHILRPALSFFSAGNQSVQRRYTIHASANLRVKENDQLFFSAHLMQQAGATETVAGAAYGFGIGDADRYFYLGAWLRVKDAVYPYVGLQTDSWQAGISYDITSSDLQRKQHFTGSGEVSFLYFFNRTRGKGIPCFF